MKKISGKTAPWRQQFEFVYDLYRKKVVAIGGKPTQTGFWEYVGATRGKFQCWAKGQCPSAEDLAAMHRIFGLSYHWLLTGEGDPFDGADKDNRIAQLEARLAEKQEIIRKLEARLFVEGNTSEDFAGSTAKAAGQE